MDVTVASQIRHAFDLHSLDTHSCLYFDAQTQQPCNLALSESALQQAGVVLEYLATLSPAIPENDVPITSGIALIEPFRRLAVSVLCPNHENAATIANLIHRWLRIATENPNLFALMPGVPRSLPQLQGCLPQFTERALRSHPCQNAAQSLFSRHYTPTIRQIVLETLDDVLPVYFEDYMHSLAEGIGSRLMLRDSDHGNGTQGVSEPTIETRGRPSGSTTDQPTQSQRLISPLPQAQDSIPPPLPERSPLRTTEMNPPSFDSFTLTYDSSPTSSDASTVIADDTALSPTRAVREEPADADCVICTEPLRAETINGCRTCGMYLHARCLSPWAQQAWDRGQLRFTCPLCRAPWRYKQSIEHTTRWRENVVFTIDTIDIPAEMFEMGSTQPEFRGFPFNY